MSLGFKTNEVTTEAPAEPGDHDKMAHYVQADKLTDAIVFGTPLLALCGKMWVPTRDGLKFPVCPMCKERFEMFPEAPK